MSDATDKARRELDEAVAYTPTDTHVLLRVAFICRAALDYHDARDGPQFRVTQGETIDLHAEAEREFEEAVK